MLKEQIKTLDEYEDSINQRIFFLETEIKSLEAEIKEEKNNKNLIGKTRKQLIKLDTQLNSQEVTDE